MLCPIGDKPALHLDVMKAIIAIYQQLRKDDLLDCCLCGYTQNLNISLNSMIGTFAPKNTFSDFKPVEIIAYLTKVIQVFFKF